MRLAGKIALITGAASGIGRETALLFAREGADIAILDIDLEGAQEVAKEVEALGRTATAARADVTDQAQVNSAVLAAVEKFGRIDILINDAAAAKYIPFLEMPLDDWKRIVDVCLTGYFIVAQAVARQMAAGKRGGKIVNIASVAGLIGNTGACAYGATKGGVIALTKVMSVELGPLGINVNAVAPGPIKTPMVAKLARPEEVRRRLARMPIARMGKPEEIAAACLFLAGSESQYVHGHVLTVDGGFTSAGDFPAQEPIEPI